MSLTNRCTAPDITRPQLRLSCFAASNTSTRRFKILYLFHCDALKVWRNLAYCASALCCINILRLQPNFDYCRSFQNPLLASLACTLLCRTMTRHTGYHHWLLGDYKMRQYLTLPFSLWTSTTSSAHRYRSEEPALDWSTALASTSVTEAVTPALRTHAHTLHDQQFFSCRCLRWHTGNSVIELLKISKWYPMCRLG